MPVSIMWWWKTLKARSPVRSSASAFLYPPSTPTGLSAAATAHNAIALSWTDPTDPSDLTDGFRLEVSNSGPDPWTLVAEPTGTTYTHTGFTVTAEPLADEP